MNTQDIPTGTPGHRRVIFGIFVLVFLLTCAAVLLYGSGYTIHLPSRSVITTGSLLIRTEPADPTITVAGMVSTEATPLRLTRLIPRRVSVRIEKEGYYPWEKQVDIVAKQTTFVTTVLFLKNEPVVLRQLASGAQDALSPDGELLLSFKPRQNLLTVTLRNGVTDTVPIHAPFVPDRMRAWWNPDGTRTLLQFTTASSTATHSVFLSLARPLELSPSVESFGYRPVRWSKQKPWLLEVTNPLNAPFVMHSLTHEIGNDVAPAATPARAFVMDDMQQSGADAKSTTLFYNEHEVWYQDGVDQYSLLLRSSERVQRALPIPDAPFAAVLTDGGLQLIEYDARDGRNRHTLLPEKNIEDIAISKNGRVLYAILDDAGKSEEIQLPLR